MSLRSLFEGQIDKENGKENELIKLINTETGKTSTAEYFHGLVGCSFDARDYYRFNYEEGKLKEAIELICKNINRLHILAATEILKKMADFESRYNSGKKIHDLTDREINVQHAASRLRLTAIFIWHVYHFFQQNRDLPFEKLIEQVKIMLSKFNAVMKKETPVRDVLDKMYKAIQERQLDFEKEVRAFKNMVFEEDLARVSAQAAAEWRSYHIRDSQFEEKYGGDKEIKTLLAAQQKTLEENELACEKLASLFKEFLNISQCKVKLDISNLCKVYIQGISSREEWEKHIDALITLELPATYVPKPRNVILAEFNPEHIHVKNQPRVLLKKLSDAVEAKRKCLLATKKDLPFNAPFKAKGSEIRKLIEITESNVFKEFTNKIANVDIASEATEAKKFQMEPDQLSAFPAEIKDDEISIYGAIGKTISADLAEKWLKEIQVNSTKSPAHAQVLSDYTIMMNKSPCLNSDFQKGVIKVFYGKYLMCSYRSVLEQSIFGGERSTSTHSPSVSEKTSQKDQDKKCDVVASARIT